MYSALYRETRVRLNLRAAPMQKECCSLRRRFCSQKRISPEIEWKLVCKVVSIKMPRRARIYI